MNVHLKQSLQFISKSSSAMAKNLHVFNYDCHLTEIFYFFFLPPPFFFFLDFSALRTLNDLQNAWITVAALTLV